MFRVPRSVKRYVSGRQGIDSPSYFSLWSTGLLPLASVRYPPPESDDRKTASVDPEPVGLHPDTEAEDVVSVDFL
jgi:hypothetical protein